MLSWFYLTGQAISTPNSGAEQDLGTVKDCAGAADPGGNSEVWEPVVFPSQLSRGLGTSSSARSAHPSLNIRAPQGSQHPKCVPRSPQPPSGSGEVGSRQRQPGDLPFSRSFPPRAQVCQGRYTCAKAAAPGGLARRVPALGTRLAPNATCCRPRWTKPKKLPRLGKQLGELNAACARSRVILIPLASRGSRSGVGSAFGGAGGRGTALALLRSRRQVHNLRDLPLTYRSLISS